MYVRRWRHQWLISVSALSEPLVLVYTQHEDVTLPLPSPPPPLFPPSLPPSLPPSSSLSPSSSLPPSPFPPLYFRQAEFGMYVRMALLAVLVGLSRPWTLAGTSKLYHVMSLWLEIGITTWKVLSIISCVLFAYWLPLVCLMCPGSSLKPDMGGEVYYDRKWSYIYNISKQTRHSYVTTSSDYNLVLSVLSLRTYADFCTCCKYGPMGVPVLVTYCYDMLHVNTLRKSIVTMYTVFCYSLLCGWATCSTCTISVHFHYRRDWGRSMGAW